MNEHRSSGQEIRRVVLPSGRTIDVVHFDSEAVENLERELHVCPSCASELVQPVEWHEETQGDWQLTLECPNCGWCESGRFAQRQVEAFEDRLDEGLSEMIGDLQRLAQSNLAGEFERFARALRADLILPEDF